MANWQERFDALLKGMTQGEPHKSERRAEKKVTKPKPSDQ